MNISDLFFKTNPLIQMSLFLLIIFSIVSWTIIFYRVYILNHTYAEFKKFKKKFWSGIELSRLYQEISLRRRHLVGIEQIFYSGFKEFSRLYHIKNSTSEIIIEGTLRAMYIVINLKLKKLEAYKSILGTFGSVSPYIGLFGTVIGIMNIFLKLDNLVITTNYNNNINSLHAIAPSIAEALISTAFGLFVAIPAVIAFNYLNTQIDKICQDYNNFVEEFILILNHQIFFTTNNHVSSEKKKY